MAAVQSDRWFAPIVKMLDREGLLEDPRFCKPTEQLYGEDALGIVSDANRYVGHTRWHPDHSVDPAEDCYGVKFAFYLQPVRKYLSLIHI